MRSLMIDKKRNDRKNGKIAFHCKFTFFQGKIDELLCKLKRTDENVESQMHHQKNENGSTGEKGNKNKSVRIYIKLFLKNLLISIK